MGDGCAGFYQVIRWLEGVRGRPTDLTDDTRRGRRSTGC